MIPLKKQHASYIAALKSNLKQRQANCSLKDFFMSMENLRLVNFPEKDYDFVFTTHDIDTIIKHTLKLADRQNKDNPIFNALKNKKHKCLAPFTTMNFDSTGNINVCCYNRTYSIGSYPEVTPYQAWFGKRLKFLKQQLQNLNFNYGCTLCSHQIANNNYHNSLLKKFDIFEDMVGLYPINFEFEFSNICNYECIMCGGKWSSSIRKNREKLSPIKSPYDDKFIEDLKVFIPNLKYTRFLGGEPFLTPLYYKIFDLLAEQNNQVHVHVTSNGSICNSKILDYKNKLPNFGVVLSIDSLQKNTYELIRKNGNFDSVLKNINTFFNHKMLLGIAFSPMIQNVFEMPDIINFCIEKNILFSFNTVSNALGGKVKGIHENGDQDNVWTGKEYVSSSIVLDEKIPEFCLSTLSNEKLDTIINKFEKLKYTGSYRVTMNSFITYLKSLKK